MHDNLLWLKMPRGIRVFDFADDIAVVEVGKIRLLLKEAVNLVLDCHEMDEILGVQTSIKKIYINIINNYYIIINKYNNICI